MQGFCWIFASSLAPIIPRIGLYGLKYKDFSIIQCTLVKCPDCDSFLDIVKPSQLNDVIAHPAFCVECEEEKHITTDDIYVAYNLIMKPNATEAEISKAIERKLNCEGSNAVNFTTADSLSNDLDSLYEAFYNPSESAYRKFVELRDKLDWDYGKNRTEKGKALEKIDFGDFW